MLRRFVVFLCCWLTGLVPLIGQSNLGFRTFTYTTDNGLPSNGLKGMQWDEESGFLWIATEAGLSRFNGIDFANFTRGNTDFISSERMRFMVRNGNDQIRAADMDGNVFSISQNHPTLLFGQRGQPDNWANKLVGAAISDEFFNVKSIPNPQRVSFPFAQVLPRNKRSAYLVNPAGIVVWLDLDKDSVQILDKLGKNNISGCRQNGRFYLIKKGDKRVYRLDESSKSAIGTNFYLPGKDAKLYWEAGMPSPVVIDGSMAWLMRTDGEDIRFEVICREVPNLGLLKFVQYSEKKGLLFLGTASRGFAVVRSNRITQIRKANFSPEDATAYYSQWEWRPGSILTNEGHVLGKATDQKPPINSRFGFSIYEDGDSLLWYSTGRVKKSGSILYKLNKKTGQRTAFDKTEIFNVFAFARWKGQVLIGNHKGLGLLEGDSTRFLFKSTEGQGDPIAYNLLELEPGVFSMTTCSGWVRFDLNKMQADTLLSLPGYCVRTQVRIGDHVFIGTYGKGIYIYHRGKLKSIPTDKNGFLLYTHCFVPDSNDYVWMSTNRGLLKAQATEMIQAFEKGLKNVYYHYYGRNDGMDMTELNGGCSPCATTLSNGTISFPSMDGLLWVSPATSSPLLPEGPIYLDEIRVDNDTMSERQFQELELPRSHKTISLRLAFSAWCNPENIYLEYQLNDTTKWISLSGTEGPAIRLTNLSPGKYTLRIRKRNGFGVSNFSVKTLQFTVGKAWYDQPLFYFGCVGLVILVIYQFSRYQNRRLIKRQRELEGLVSEKTRDLQEQNDVLEKNNQIKTRLISIISHDIVTPLKFLTVAGRGLKEKKNQLSEEEQQETLGEITNTAQELQLLSTNILNWIKYQNENRRLQPERVCPYELTQQVFGVLGSLTKEKNLSLENRIDPRIRINQYAEPMKILIYNLVSNSIRYSDKGTITVDGTQSGEELILSISDEGIGMSAAKVESLLNDSVSVREISAEKRSGHGLGYLIIRDLVQWMQARLEVDSTLGGGTTVRLFIRALRPHPSETA